MSNGKGPAKALLDDKKTQRELQEAASSLKEAADALRGGKKQKKRSAACAARCSSVGGGIAALALSEGLRKKVLDALFGAEEEFEYTSTTSPSNGGASAGASHDGRRCFVAFSHARKKNWEGALRGAFLVPRGYGSRVGAVSSYWSAAGLRPAARPAARRRR